MNLLAFFFAACVVVGTTPAQAVLLERDLQRAGDALLTFDEASGLEWLDLPLTTGLSASAVLTGAGGWVSRGFRYATTDEVHALFLRSHPSAHLSNGHFQVTPENLAGAARLLDLLGTVYIQQPGNDYNIVGNGMVGVDEPRPGWVGGASFGTNLAQTAGFFFINDGQWDLGFSDPRLASYLVRIASPVPEPMATWMLVTGLAGVAGIVAHRRRHKPKPHKAD